MPTPVKIPRANYDSSAIAALYIRCQQACLRIFCHVTPPEISPSLSKLRFIIQDFMQVCASSNLSNYPAAIVLPYDGRSSTRLESRHIHPVFWPHLTDPMSNSIGDYCDVYLTHDSMSVRKAHNSGRNHLRNVLEYYQQIGQEKAQSVIDSITSSYAAEGQAVPNPAMAPPGAFPPPPFAFPPGRPGQFPPLPFGMPPPGAPGGAPGMPPPPGARGLPFPPPFPGASGAAPPGSIPPPPLPNMPPGQGFLPPPGGFPPGFPPIPPPGQGPAGYSPSPGPGMGGPPGPSDGYAPPGAGLGGLPGPPPGLGDSR
ncbi:putative U1 snRNP complex component Yhc1 [Aspergillus affinis]|uniref:putative U1 snRNP complex component Yhc1 n=1 Tax=Aspergillus affinis TaxID=1070780 RepID=UPI0022FE70CF|nr:U1 small nuclear ribonucleoprotein C [Aspergillus affinis]KAI9039917.1 U1 small nuclear ribonucleoprotein C [Aspergillus affinis]